MTRGLFQVPKKRKLEFNWTKRKPKSIFSLDLEPTAPTFDDVVAEEPSDIFKLLFSDNLVRHIYEQTTNYSGLQFTEQELNAVIGVVVASGCLPLPRRRMFWSSDDLQRNLAISGAISRNKFESIFTKLHFVDNSDIDGNDKFAKVKPIFDILNENFVKYGPCSSSFCVDECIVPYYGRHNAKQFIRGKPIRFGYKVSHRFIAYNRLFCHKYMYMHCSKANKIDN